MSRAKGAWLKGRRRGLEDVGGAWRKWAGFGGKGGGACLRGGGAAREEREGAG